MSTVLFWIGIYILIGWSMGMFMYFNTNNTNIKNHPTSTIVTSIIVWPIYFVAFISGLVVGTIRKLNNNNNDNDG
jgi:H+/Cl- antiporter ClcA